MSEGKGFSVLCFVKDTTVVEGLEPFLNESGFRLTFGTAGEGGLFEAFTGAPVDLVMIQDDLPNMDAQEICKEIRTSPSSPEIAVPILVIVSNSTMKRVTVVANSGPNEIILFPFDGEKLAARMTSAMHDPREFIQCEAYVGPDRRSFSREHYTGPGRRAGDAAAELQARAEAVS